MSSLSLYTHIPYCKSKCPYCDFYSGPAAELGVTQGKYFDALAEELQLAINAYGLRGRMLHTLYFGGGTPGYCDPALYRAFIQVVRESFEHPDHAEWTLEINPGATDENHIDGFMQLGMNRFSVGVQSFQPRLLKTLGRIHQAEDARRMLSLLRPLTDDGRRLSLDLIFAVDSQTLEEWEADLDAALEHAPGHISLYGLTYHEGTPFHRLRAQGHMREANDESQLAMYDLARAKLTQAGYEHYEISNFARPGCQCAHNRTYWEHGDYLGLGASAHSCIDGRRFWNPADAERWSGALLAGKLPHEDEETPSERSRLAERVMLGLRLLEGLSLSAFRRETGIDAAEYFAPEIAKLTEQGLLECVKDRLRLTASGLHLADTVMAEFF
ncbi:radical SAM family heme chaperone HemW [Candidatus Sumerlaeota bacterium]|nr:radical SAM family heme chaperone HemW [Candidatus Sumerlaeota bacterium]